MAENKVSLPDISCLEQLFGMDLQVALEENIDLGDHIIVIGDFNSEYGELVPWMLDPGLLELIEARNGKEPKKIRDLKMLLLDVYLVQSILKDSKVDSSHLVSG